MQLANETPFVARLLRIERSEEDIQSVVVIKATFEREAGGHFVPAAEQVPIVEDRLDTAFGVFHTDSYVRKDGVDVCVLGTVRLPSAKPVAHVQIVVGAVTRELTVFGDRHWVKRRGDLAPSAPEPFEETPLSYRLAYGGTTEHEYETHAWPDNPTGRGYYLSEPAAEGGLLPNIEAPDTPPITHWEQRPLVAGWAPYPLFWGLRAREGIDVSTVTSDSPLPKVKPRLNNHAHPSLIFHDIEPESVIVLRGLRHQRLTFPVPVVRPVVEVRCGEQTSVAEGQLDGVFLWADVDRVTVTHRAHFDYVFKKGQIRGARLVDAAVRKGA